MISDFIVTERAMRPASAKRECFYCRVPVGGTHKPTCVLIDKKVKVRLTVDYEVAVPARWDAAAIEFQRNAGSWCANNALQELAQLFGQEGGPCMCNAAMFTYLGGDSAPYLNEAGQ